MKLVRTTLLFLTPALATPLAMAQLSYTEPGQVLVQTFDEGLPGDAVTLDWVNNSTFPGWYLWQTGGGGSATVLDPVGVPASIRRTYGSSGGIRFYQWRTDPLAADGAFGSLAADGSGDLIRAVRITNNTGKVLKSFALSYTGEQWRTANTGAQQTIAVAYQVGAPPGDPPNLATGNWSVVPALTFVSPVPGDGSGISVNLDGSVAANQTLIDPVTINATWNPGTDLWIRFYDDNSPGVDHGLAIDDVTFSGSEEGDPSGLILWAWSGAVTGNSARVVGKVTVGAEAVLEVTPAGGNTAAYPSESRTASTGGDLLSFPVSGLIPNTTYTYRIRSGNNLGEVGTFKTFPVGPASFEFLFASCAVGGSSSAVFSTMAAHNALFFYHMGDMNYEDTNQNNIIPYHQNYDATLASPTQRALYRSLPLAYTWDDHDYCGNDSDTNRVGKTAVRLSYYANFPHYPISLPKPGPIAQAFSVGRVRFILLDTRSERNAPTTKIGTAQMQWLKDELLAAKDTHPVIGLGLGVPWISTSSGDRWGETAADRAEISNFIKNNNITGVFGMHGDAHMLAYDDGRNNNYATGGSGPNFPTFNAAAMDRSGSTKGGPYSGGTLAAGGQYGLMAVTDNGGTQITLRFSGRRHGEGEMMTYTFSVPAPAHTPKVNAWRQARFGTAEPTGDAANEADPDGDGLPNLLEYAFDLNPQVASNEGRPAVGLTLVNGEEHLTFSHRRRTDDALVVYQLEGSTDLVTWTPVLFPPHNTPEAAGATAEVVTLVDPQPYSESGFRFLRMRVSN